MATREPKTDLPPVYDPSSVERELYERWERAGVFSARAERSSRAGGDSSPFVIAIPPPNVTAVLHMGHGLNNSIQDVITRWRRMAGDETLWIPGTDHAGIATQNVVERSLAAEGKTKTDLGRETFVNRTAEFVDRTGGTILEQLRAIGCSCDWSRTAYTLSPELSVAVREAFVSLYERGLIYRGHRVIHWCPRCLTSLSDEEAEHKDEEGTLYHVRYAVAGSAGAAVTIATTRPETILADVAVAVNPDDDRYRALVGKKVLLPLLNLEIPVIADSAVDMEFGTGALKITPAHDPNDFEIGKRHGLASPVVISPDGRVAGGGDESSAGRVPPELDGLDRFDARMKIVEMLHAAGALAKTEKHAHAVRHCYRCGTVVEPRLSDQWFVKMAPLAEPALAAVRDARIRILPDRWEAVYVNWLENIRDWNISRQLWWGHRIPVWYCARCPELIVRREAPASCPACGGEVRQDEDVLDTWFSSWLWPFSTLGWPAKTEDLRAFYPTDVVVSAPEILFFWIARMVMAGFAFMGESPFHTIYLHGTVRDMQNRKMSKMLGNGIDPLDVVSLYGADALRYTVVAGMGMGSDLLLDPADLEKSFAGGRNFVTKLWNVGRFLLTNIGEDPVADLSAIDAEKLSRADRWILWKLDAAIAECDAALGEARPPRGGGVWSDENRNGLRLNEYCETARRFLWNELADWYVETAKPRLAAEGTNAADRAVARAVLVHVFDSALRLLHPVVPYVTEVLWQRLPKSAARSREFLAASAWPAGAGSPPAADFELIREAVAALRQIRADYNIPPAKPISATIVASGTRSVYEEEAGVIGALARSLVSVGAAPPGGAAAHVILSGGAELVAPLAGIVDVGKECEKLKAELSQLETQLGQLSQRLQNEGFVGRAPKNVVEGERRKEQEWSARRDMLRKKVGALCG